MDELREVMRWWVTGVSIVTAENDGVLHGMTVGSLVSISIDPPRVVVTLANNTRTYKLVADSGFFGVTLLSAEQEVVSDRFAGRIPDEGDRFAGLETMRLSQGIPVLKGGLGHLVCKVIHTYEMPNSTLFIGEVLEARRGSGRLPLVYANRKYHRMEL
ncbi:MAG: hypothetical protein C0401_08700 [Anaerolinea sp.]|nr:hypothetical protein [Anaerolinea sp.]